MSWYSSIRSGFTGKSFSPIKYSSYSVLSESSNLIFDTEGRVQFSKKLLEFAKIKSDILFVGLGKTFQVWNPKNFNKFKSFARKKALQSRSTLKWDNN